jgi:hypothetical protein
LIFEVLVILFVERKRDLLIARGRRERLKFWIFRCTDFLGNEVIGT